MSERSPLRLILTVAGAAIISSAAQAQYKDGTAKGVNPKDNITKTEVIYRFDALDLADYSQSLTLKYDRAFTSTWGGNVEVPFVAFSGFGTENFGLGDLQMRLRYSTQLGRSTVVLGAELVVPTASEDSLGRGKVQLNPAVGYVVPLADTAFLYMGYKHFLSITGDDDRYDINESQPRLILGYTSLQGWWLLGDAKYTKSWETRDEQLDLEMEYGRMVGASTGAWLRLGTSAFDSDRDAMILAGVRFIR